MIKRGVAYFRDKRVLLLQGPVGPFFKRLSLDLEWAGAKVCKVNFNGGDWVFFRSGLNFRGHMDEWPGFLETLLQEREIDIILLFGDCRPIHRVARETAQRLGIEIGVFEEGYIRPDYITFEQFGVNGHSPLTRLPRRRAFAEKKDALPFERVGNYYWHALLWVCIYYLFSALLWTFFRKYRHHRPLSLVELFPWLRGYLRKGYYYFREFGLERKLTGPLYAKNFFLVPLQVHNDTQICVHSDFATVREFIFTVMKSFASCAPAETLLVIKHHPLDRGYHDYSRVIRQLSRQLDITGRVYYIHDQHLPTLLRQARGVIVVNSTVGLSAIHHKTPVKACGRALYDIPGLTFQGTLDEFWCAAQSFRIERSFYLGFRRFLIENSQLNGSFYRRLAVPGSHAGLHWIMQTRTRNEAPGKIS